MYCFNILDFVACDFALLISDPSEVLIIARTERGQELVDSAKAGCFLGPHQGSELTCQWLMSSSKVFVLYGNRILARSRNPVLGPGSREVDLGPS